MSNTRPERIDRHGLRHRHGCPALNVVTRESHTRANHIYAFCRDCGSCALLPVLDVDGPAVDQ